MSTLFRPRAAFGIKRRNVPGVLQRAQAMYNAMTANVATFASPTIAMTAFLAIITALTVAQEIATETKARGSTTLRNTKRDAAWTAMEILQKYVQGLADVLSAESAVSLIESAGMVVARTATQRKAVLTATLTTTPGTVHLDANRTVLVGNGGASKKELFNWQWSADGGKTWNDMSATTYASTEIPGLTLLGTYGFRVRVTIAKVDGPWSQAVSLLVH